MNVLAPQSFRLYSKDSSKVKGYLSGEFPGKVDGMKGNQKGQGKGLSSNTAHEQLQVKPTREKQKT